MWGCLETLKGEGQQELSFLLERKASGLRIALSSKYPSLNMIITNYTLQFKTYCIH